MKPLFFTFASCLLASHALGQITHQVELAPERTIQNRFRLTVGEAPVHFALHPAADEKAKALSSVDLRPDAKGITLHIVRKGEAQPDAEKSLVFWPSKGSRGERGVEGLEPQSWKGRELHGLLRSDGQSVSLWVEGKLLLQVPLPAGGGSLQVRSKAGALQAEAGAEQGGGDLWVPVELAHLIRPKAKGELVEKGEIPFEIFAGEHLSLREAGWPEAGNDRGGYTEAYDGSGYFVADRRVPLVQVPGADYVAAHLLAYAEAGEDTVPLITLRVGRRISGGGLLSQVLIRDYAASVPVAPGKLSVVTLPLTEQIAQDLVDGRLDIELTKEVRLARRTPDPNRFRWRPLGKPSGVVLAGMTLEKSPLQMRVEPLAKGGLFQQPEKVGFSVTLQNITATVQPYTLELQLGGQATVKQGEIAPGESGAISLAADEPLAPGHYPAVVSLRSGQRPLLTRTTALGILPADDRQHRATAAWGTWDFSGGHFTSPDGDLVGTLMQRLGLRYGMLGFPYDVRSKYGVVKGNHYRITFKEKEPTFLAGYEKAREENPDLIPEVYIFHEASISGGHATRIPDYFHDRPPYKLNAEEQAQFDEFQRLARKGVEEIRSKYPEVKFHLGNGPIPLREEFARSGYPSSLYDTFGNENPTFARIPETQPPDPIANNSSLWMDHEMIKGYGLKGVGVSQAHETIYPGTNPGNLSYASHADYTVRHILHSMSWGMPRIRPGGIIDVGNSYYHSNWGGTGFFTQHPRLSPKPAAIAYATLTRVLDGASYEGPLDLGSDSAYALRFRRQDGQQVVALWTVRGEREASLKVENAAVVTQVALLGAEDKLSVKEGEVSVTLSASPQWLLLPGESKLAAGRLAAPRYPGSEPEGKVSLLDPLQTLEGWQVVAKANPLLEYYNPMTPRRLGNFRIVPVDHFEGRAALSISAGPVSKGKETMPMVQELERKEPIPLPGKPTELGLWINGNSGWGRIIFELEDASGQRWISIGAKARGGSEWLADWLGKERAENYVPGEIADWNTDDAWSLSRINWDGWRYLGIALPGNYPGEGFPWAANSQWKSDKDGVVHYPLKLCKVIVELPEKLLHLRDYRPARRAEIYLRDLVAVERPVDAPKQAVSDYQESVQTTVR